MSNISDNDLREIVDVLCMTALELPVTPGQKNQSVTADDITSQICISGAWQGTVSVRASKVFLSAAAGRMFSCPLDELGDKDRADALTELTNMLGGSIAH